MKVAPAVSISYVVYEHVRKLLGVTMTWREAAGRHIKDDYHAGTLLVK